MDVPELIERAADLERSHGLEKREVFILDELASLKPCVTVSNTHGTVAIAVMDVPDTAVVNSAVISRAWLERLTIRRIIIG